MLTIDDLRAHHKARIEKEVQDMLLVLGPGWQERKQRNLEYSSPRHWVSSVECGPLYINNVGNGEYCAFLFVKKEGRATFGPPPVNAPACRYCAVGKCQSGV